MVNRSVIVVTTRENADVPQIDSPLVVETGDELTPDEAERRRHAADRREDGEDVDDFRGRAVEFSFPRIGVSAEETRSGTSS